MRFDQWMTCLTSGFILAGTALSVKASPVYEQVQIPQCLAAAYTGTYETLAENQDFKIISLPSAAIDELTILADKVQCGRFINISQKFVPGLVNSHNQAQDLLAIPAILTHLDPNAVEYKIKHEKEVSQAIAAVQPDNIWQNLTHMTSYENRSANTDTGVETAYWLKDQFDSMAKTAGRTDVESYFVATGLWQMRYRQPSLVTVIGNKNDPNPGIVIGAHMDTLGGRMPGAGDDGSGSVSALETARVLLNSGLAFKRPIYIIWYAAEERGLVGSQYVVTDFIRNKQNVMAAIQFDMTGYRVDANDPTIWLYRDYTDKKLTSFVADLLTNYVKVPVQYSKCGYGCSDHASWNARGIPAAFPCESSFDVHNPYIHTSSDTMSLLTLEHMSNFAKLGVAYAIELGME